MYIVIFYLLTRCIEVIYTFKMQDFLCREILEVFEHKLTYVPFWIFMRHDLGRKGYSGHSLSELGAQLFDKGTPHITYERCHFLFLRFCYHKVDTHKILGHFWSPSQACFLAKVSWAICKLLLSRLIEDMVVVDSIRQGNITIVMYWGNSKGPSCERVRDILVEFRN